MTDPTPKQPFNRMRYDQITAKLKIARGNLFLMVIFTALNVIFAAQGSSLYMLFSASVPYAITLVGADLCGFMPDEYYEAYGKPLDGFLPGSVFIVCIAIAFIIIAAYLLCAFLSKKYTAGFIVALVMFSIDTFVLFIGGIRLDMLLDIAFHIWVIVYLVWGIVYSSKHKKLAGEAEAAILEQREAINDLDPSEKHTSAVLRDADMSIKFRVLAEANAEGHNICYRRIKKVNELVVDGKVYAAITFKFLESRHTLAAQIDGHTISAGFDGTYSFIAVNDVVVVSKIRIV